MHTVITTPQQVTPGWLTAVLRERGALPHGQVLRVTPGQPRSSFASSIWNLDIAYSGLASNHPPENLFLKCSDPAAAPGVVDPTRLQQEIVFYQSVAPEMAAPFIIPCYSAARDPHTGGSHILLEDVSATHVPVSIPPALQNYEQAVDTLAGLHAFWWDHPSLGKQIGSFPTPAERQQECVQAQQVTHAFMDYLGDRLPPSWREIYLRVLPALPHLFQRHASGRNLTSGARRRAPRQFSFSESRGGRSRLPSRLAVLAPHHRRDRPHLPAGPGKRDPHPPADRGDPSSPLPPAPACQRRSGFHLGAVLERLPPLCDPPQHFHPRLALVAVSVGGRSVRPGAQHDRLRRPALRRFA